MNVCIGFFMVATAINLFITFCFVYEGDMKETLGFCLLAEILIALIVFGCGLMTGFR